MKLTSVTPFLAGALRAALCLALVSTASIVQAVQDNFASADSLTYTAGGIFPSFTGFSNAGATAEPGELGHFLRPTTSAVRSLWTNFTVNAPGFVNLSTGGSNFDSVLAVYTGTSVKALKRIAADDDFAVGNATSQVSFLAKPGVIYRVAVDSKNGPGTGNLSMTGFTPLSARSWYASLLDSSFQGSGLLTVTTTLTGAVSGTLKQGAKSYPFTGAMAPNGRIVIYINRITPDGPQPAILDVTQVTGGDRMDGTIYADSEEMDDNFSTFTISLLPAAKYTAAIPCPRKGAYTFTTGSVTNVGFAGASMTVSALGAVSVTGFTGDGATFTLGGPLLLSPNGNANSGVFRGRQVVGGTGHVTVSIFVDGTTFPASVSGGFFACRGIKPAANFLPGGFYLGSDIFGGAYTPPLAGARMNSSFDPFGGNGLFAATSSLGFVNQFVNLLPTNTFTYAGGNPPKLALTVNKANGMVTGSVNIGAVKSTVRAVSVFQPVSPFTRGFFGFASGPQNNGTVSILAQ